MAQYKGLLKAVQQSVTEAKVFKVGTTKGSVFIAGKTDEGDWTGLKTTAVKT
jgi:hypothetical protein